MSRKARSIKGEVVDFDLFEIKRKIGEKPISADVENREKFVYSKRRRSAKRVINKMLDENAVDLANNNVKVVDSTPTPSLEAKAPSSEEPVKQKKRIVKKKK